MAPCGLRMGRPAALLGLAVAWRCSAAFVSPGLFQRAGEPAAAAAAASALRGGAASAEQSPETAGLPWPALGLVLAGAACLGSRRASRVSRKGRGRFEWRYGGSGAPTVPDFLVEPKTDGKGTPGGFKVPAWLTLQKWESFTAGNRARSVRWWLQSHDESGAAVVDREKEYSVPEAVDLLLAMNERAPLKFDATVECSMVMNLDPKYPDQQIRSSISLPHGTGKSVRVAVFCDESEQEEVMALGAYKCGKELADELAEEKINFDILLAKPQMMPRLAKLGKVLGPRRLMPSPKSGTVVLDYAQAIEDFKGRTVELRSDKWSLVACPAGKLSFGKDKLVENFRAILRELAEKAPAGAKSQLWKQVHIGATMSPSIKIAASEFPKVVKSDD